MYTKTWSDEVVVKSKQSITGSDPVLTTLKNTFPQSRSGERVPEWRKKIEAGEFAASAFSSDRTRVSYLTDGGVTVSYTNPGYPTTVEEFSGCFRKPVQPSISGVPVEVSNKALARILGKIRNETENFNVLPALGELRQTVRQFGAPMSAILSLTDRHVNKLELAARGLRGTTSFRRVAWHRIVASSYLEYAFGMVPLMQDTVDLAESLARWKAEKEGELPRPTHTILKASAEQNTGSVDNSTFGWLSPCGNISVRDSYTDTFEYGTRYQVKLKHSLQADFGSNDRLLQLLGFGNVLNFIPTIWEILPWSWLADYFLNVQQIIEAGVTDTSNVEWIIRTDRSFAQKTWVGLTGGRALVAGWLPSKTAFPTSEKNLGSWRVQRTIVTRSLPTSLGLPIPAVSYPNSIKKWTNMTAALFARRAHANSLWLF